ncbi:hypothetical protein [Xenorhabdus koppenhoeferi]|uniref:hypothetical protein n=1 Tax=Xenorhabdus koppenhoeferi TaxID=351659 RepID=UPI000B819CE5|nr:hypothetical protein [Xenorhabdus koppenhoeferi]
MVQFYPPNRRSVNRDIISVASDNLDAQGQGIARHQGKTIPQHWRGTARLCWRRVIILSVVSQGLSSREKLWLR